MNATLRKLAASIVLHYADGSQAQTLVGTDFMLDQPGNGFSVSIDLSSNLLSRNRGLLCYYEAQGLLMQHAQLQSIRINEKELALSLGRELKPTAPVVVRLTLGDDKIFTFKALPSVTERAVTFTVQPA